MAEIVDGQRHEPFDKQGQAKEVLSIGEKWKEFYGRVWAGEDTIPHPTDPRFEYHSVPKTGNIKSSDVMQELHGKIPGMVPFFVLTQRAGSTEETIHGFFKKFKRSNSANRFTVRKDMPMLRQYPHSHLIPDMWTYKNGKVLSNVVKILRPESITSMK